MLGSDIIVLFPVMQTLGGNDGGSGDEVSAIHMEDVTRNACSLNQTISGGDSGNDSDSECIL